MTMNIWHDIDPKRISPDDFIAVIEIPKGRFDGLKPLKHCENRLY